MRYPRHLYVSQLLVALSLVLALAAPAICQTATMSTTDSKSEASLAVVVAQLSTQVAKLSTQVAELQKQVAELRQGYVAGLPQGPAAALPEGPVSAGAVVGAESNNLIRVGTSKPDVLRLLGACDKVQMIGTSEFWNYGTSFILFDGYGLVHGWHAGDHDIKTVAGISLPANKTAIAPLSPTTPPRVTAPAASASGVAENGSYYGQISTATGKPKTTHVNGYYRKDGTYVRGHYRSK